MTNRLYELYKILKSNPRLKPLFDTFLFVFLTLVIHYTYRYWEINLHREIFGFQLIPDGVFVWFTEMVYQNTRFVVDLLLPVETMKHTLYFPNQCSVTIVQSCSGVKQILQFALLILIYPGPWKHKAWFIPAGILVVHLTNVFRLSGLCVVMNYWPQHWHFAHDYPFRVIFYVVIFFLWVIWNDKFYHRKEKPISRLAD